MGRMKRWTMVGTTVAAMLGMSLISAPTAAADSSARIDGVTVTFKSHGEVFTLDDTACDGNPVYLLYKYDGGGERRYNFSGGCNASPSVINLSFAEGNTIQYRGCVNRAGIWDRCSGWTTDKT
ncbi:hypothetical protein FFT09_01800 [Saccharomonospora piscinae]|uniref:hypothetical protein n=1 Tax=Saccharomonospora piscinae TaxID=687388 RepID=UPI001105F918|nr:hypothetical protein [Saccharomonospora piscinae]TLW94644.1 hypothetical protein FFT09_01800 [Saccharomonospora piscinae]